MSKFRILQQKILRLSDGETWETAVTEWTPDVITWEENHCLCTQVIWENCAIRNHANGNRTTVGNECIKRFLGVDFAPVFRGIRRVRKDVSASFGPDAIAHAAEKRWLDDWEQQFYWDTMRKRVLSDRQLRSRVAINEKMLAKFTEPAPRPTHIDDTPFDWPFRRTANMKPTRTLWRR